MLKIWVSKYYKFTLNMFVYLSLWNEYLFVSRWRVTMGTADQITSHVDETVSVYWFPEWGISGCWSIWSKDSVQTTFCPQGIVFTMGYLHYMAGSRGGKGSRHLPSWKSQKYKVSKQYWSGSPENHKATESAFNVLPSSPRQRNAI